MAFQVDEKLRNELGRVAVIYGGNSSERSVSLKSGAAVLSALTRAGVDAFGIDLYGETGDENPFGQLQKEPFDRAFLILHGPVGEDGTLQGALEMLGKPYTGSGVAASAIGMDKLRTKLIWLGHNLPTPPFAVISEDQDLSEVARRLGWPMIVKPAHEGSSLGMSKVRSESELSEALRAAEKFDRSVIAERWMSGGEYTVAILDGKALPPIQLITQRDFYDFDAKYVADDTQYRFAHDLSAEQEDELKRLAEKAFLTVGCRGWGRVDVMRDSHGAFQLLEVNTAPGMTDHSLVPMAAREQGISFEELVVEIVKTAV
ncbi:MAG: D-alanine--D-alanine ligase [Neptuniibacter caesariensis]|uniref:D-alanine--D-alanine ligase n=1 Tax=Neptuniibacter caesariensis TaxID=207954 RepID=A0A2G6JPS6_NEPCE|nr:MAG: D-alanine--D-alanine ligase [Neptuniibacter caesariensis]